jgi:hypothetical protein
MYICFFFLLFLFFVPCRLTIYIWIYTIITIITISISGLSCPRSNSYLSSLLSQNRLARSRIALFVGLIFDLEHDARRCGQNSSRIWQGILLVACVCGRYVYQTFYRGEYSQHIGWKSFGTYYVCMYVSFIIIIIRCYYTTTYSDIIIWYDTPQN